MLLQNRNSDISLKRQVRTKIRSGGNFAMNDLVIAFLHCITYLYREGYRIISVITFATYLADMSNTEYVTLVTPQVGRAAGRRILFSMSQVCSTLPCKCCVK